MSKPASQKEEQLLRRYFDGMSPAVVADLRPSVLAAMRSNPYWEEENLPDQQLEVTGKGEVRVAPNAAAWWLRGRANDVVNLARAVAKDTVSVVPALTDAAAWAARKSGAPETAAGLSATAQREREAIDWGLGGLTAVGRAFGVNADAVDPRTAALNELVAPLISVAVAGRPKASGAPVKLQVKVPPRASVRGTPAVQKTLPMPSVPPHVAVRSVDGVVGGRGLPASARYRPPALIAERGSPRAFETRVPQTKLASSGEVFSVSPSGTVRSPGIDAGYLAEHADEFAEAQRLAGMRANARLLEKADYAARKRELLEAFNKADQEQLIADVVASSKELTKTMQRNILLNPSRALPWSKNAPRAIPVSRGNGFIVTKSGKAIPMERYVPAAAKQMIRENPVTTFASQVFEPNLNDAVLSALQRPAGETLSRAIEPVAKLAEHLPRGPKAARWITKAVLADAAIGSAVMGSRGMTTGDTKLVSRTVDASVKYQNDLKSGNPDVRANATDAYLRELSKASKDSRAGFTEVLGDIMFPSRWVGSGTPAGRINRLLRMTSSHEMIGSPSDDSAREGFVAPETSGEESVYRPLDFGGGIDFNEYFK